MSGRILAGFLAVLLLIAVPGSAEPTRVVQAKEILEKIELGQPVEYDNVIVEGDLDLSGLNLTSVAVQYSPFETYLGSDKETFVNSSIKINNSIIKGSVNLNGTAFQNAAIFEGTRFEGITFMIGSKFNQKAIFSGAQFNQNACFSYAEFNQKDDFSGAQFNQNARFNLTKFNHVAYFYRADFKHDVDFSSTEFKQAAFFSSAKFNQNADFWSAQFNQNAFFNSADFNQNADFGRAQFNQNAFFSSADFKHDAHFNRADFNQTTFFNRVEFNQFAYFAEARFAQESHFVDACFNDIFFNNSQFSKEAFFDGSHIKGTLSLYRTKYDTLNIRWSSINDLAYDDTAYHLLIQNFNKLGFTDDARECQYSYRCKHREELFRQGKFDLWLFDLLAYATYGYGLRPVRPLGWAALLILMGGLFFFLTGSVARSRESKEQAEKSPSAAGASQNKPEGNVSIWESLLLSATYFTSGASSIISATPGEFVPVGRGRYVVVLLRLLGWIFFVLFLSSLNRTI